MADTAEDRREGLRRVLRQIGPARLIATAAFLILAITLARFSWELPLASDAERALYDIRFLKSADRAGQDERIVLVTYNDETLELLGKRSPLDRGLLAEALGAIDAMGAKAIGIDILLDQPQAEDPVLLERLRAMKTPVWLAFASSAGEHNAQQMHYRQEQFLRAFIASAAAGPVKPASIKLETDWEDGVIRRWARPDPSLPPLLANAMAKDHPGFRRYDGRIDFRLPESRDVPVFTNLPIDVVAASGDALAEVFRGRYVLIGGDINDLDNFETPMSRRTGGWMKGLEVHAQMLAQKLDGRMPAPVPGWALWAIALAVVIAGGLSSLLEMRSWKLAVALAGQLVFFAGLPFLLERVDVDTTSVPAFGWALGWIFAFAAVGTAARAVGSEQRRFAQSALGKYLPPDVAAEIIKEPARLSLKGEKRQIYALFTDLEGFTKLSHAITPEQLSSLLNRYLDIMSDTVLRHGGTIDKFVGDAVVAFWGAPIARDDDADRALAAAVAMFEAGEDFRRAGGKGIPPLGRTRVGLHRGEAVVGNFGGEGRIQYTALGDGMNTAARLESANKALKSTILVSAEAKAGTAADIFRPLGRIVLSGRATPVEVWEPVPRIDPEDRRRMAEAWHAFEGGDVAALETLEALARDKDDAALADMVYRLREAGPGGAYVLGSK